MKKTLALFMAITLLIGAAAIPALAEETADAPDQITSATVQTGKGGRGNPQQMPGNGQNSQQPGMPGNGQNSQQPGLPGIGQNSQQPGMPGNGGRNTQQRKGFGNRNNGMADHKTDKMGKLIDPDQLLADGVITQDVYDAIVSYLNEKAQQQAAPAAPADSADAPAAPETSPESPELQLLRQLLDSGVITQEQYDILAAGFAAPEPAGAT